MTINHKKRIYGLIILYKTKHIIKCDVVEASCRNSQNVELQNIDFGAYADEEYRKTILNSLTSQRPLFPTRVLFSQRRLLQTRVLLCILGDTCTDLLYYVQFPDCLFLNLEYT